MINVSIIGASGYAGGELLRILLQHPQIRVKQATSERFAGMPVTVVHPNLRGLTDLKFTNEEQTESCDLLFVGLPNGESMNRINKYMKLTSKIIDLGADFRLRSPQDWQTWYGSNHTRPDLMDKFVYGVPEIYRKQIKSASYVAGPGCEAIVSILSLNAFLKQNLIEPENIIIDAKMGSSQGGNKSSAASHHPERAGVVRSYQPAGHRHTAEIEQTFPGTKVAISATAIDMVRGILVTIHTKLKPNVTEKDLWRAFREAYKNETFVRLIKEQRGLYRFPEPKLLQGTNYCDIGFAVDTRSNRLIIIGAVDNLVKGTSGNAVQCMNIMYGFPETTGLTFPGLHPI